MQRTVAFFPGSTIGNLEPTEAEKFLERSMRSDIRRIISFGIQRPGIRN